MLIADKSYDSEKVREHITGKGARAVMPRKCNAIIGNTIMDWGLYKYRHLVENAFARLKHFESLDQVREI